MRVVERRQVESRLEYTKLSRVIPTPPADSIPPPQGTFSKEFGCRQTRACVSVRSLASWDRRITCIVYLRADFPSTNCSLVGSFAERMGRYRLPWVRLAAAPEIGFVRGTEPRDGPELPGTGSENPWHPKRTFDRGGFSCFSRMPWLRFAQRSEIGFVSSRRYRLPWVRFAAVSEIGFVRGTEPRDGPGLPVRGSENPWHPKKTLDRGGFPCFSSMPWVRFALALENGFVSSRRYRLPLGSFCSGACDRVRFVEALRIAVGSFRAGSRKRVRFVEALQIAIGFVLQRCL